MKYQCTQSVGRSIGHLYRLGTSFLSKAYKQYGIGAGQYQFLISLYLEDGISHDVLTEKMSVDKATTTRAIMKLEEEGYVTRIVNEKDKRKYAIYLTDKALKDKEQILKISSEWEEELRAGLTEQELVTLLSILNKIENCKPGKKYSNKLKLNID